MRVHYYVTCGVSLSARLPAAETVPWCWLRRRISHRDAVRQFGRAAVGDARSKCIVAAILDAPDIGREFSGVVPAEELPSRPRQRQALPTWAVVLAAVVGVARFPRGRRVRPE